MISDSGLPDAMGAQFNQPLEQLGQNMSVIGRGAGDSQPLYRVNPVLIFQIPAG